MWRRQLRFALDILMQQAVQQNIALGDLTIPKNRGGGEKPCKKTPSELAESNALIGTVKRAVKHSGDFAHLHVS